MFVITEKCIQNKLDGKTIWCIERYDIKKNVLTEKLVYIHQQACVCSINSIYHTLNIMDMAYLIASLFLRLNMCRKLRIC